MRWTLRSLLAAHTESETGRLRLQALAEVSVSLSQQLDPTRLLQQITDALASLTGAHNVVMWEVDHAAGVLTRRAWTADPSIGAMELPSSLTLDQGGTGWIARHREPLFVEDIAADARIMAAQWALSRDLVAFAGVPVAAGPDLFGVLTLNLQRGRLLQSDDRALLTTFAAQAAVAIRNARLFAENARLYEEARHRLHELQETQVQLVQAAKLSAVGQLVSGVAHELNNPLSVVIGYGQLLLSRGVPENARRPIELIIAQGARMAKIVQSLLLFSRQRKPEHRSVDLREVINQILRLRESQLALSSIRVELDLGADVPAVRGDMHQLQQLFLNLILNAEQAILGSGVGGRRTGDCIRIATSVRRDDDTTWAITQVTDNGPGIKADVLPRIFEPFFTTKRIGDGSGLGLSVSHGIVEEHRGRLSVESTPGRTVFTVALPVMVERAEVSPPTAGTAENSGGAAVAGKGRGLLVVGGDPGLVEAMRAVLDGRGWRVEVAAGGRAALGRLKTTRYDLVIADLRMPELDGPDFYHAAVAQRHELADRFLFLTGARPDPEASRFLASTHVRMLARPFTPEGLLHAVALMSP
jgi:signal transduction histidine kinase/CheY-like chemotaxis protein